MTANDQRVDYTGAAARMAFVKRPFILEQDVPLFICAGGIR